MKAYQILKSNSYTELMYSVNELILRENWQPQGGLSTSRHPTTGESCYFQAMVLLSDD